MKGILQVQGFDTIYPFGNQVPTALLPILGREVMSYTMKALEDRVHTWMVVVSKQHVPAVEEYISGAFPELEVEILSEMPTVLEAGRYLHVVGNVLYSPEDLRALVDEKHPTLLTSKTPLLDKQVFYADGEYLSIEKDTDAAVKLFHTGAYTLCVEREIQVRSVEEYVKMGDIHNYMEHTGFLLPLLYPWHILDAQKFFLEKADMAYYIHGEAQIHPTVFMGANVVIGRGVVVEEHCELQDVCLLPGTRIGAYARVHGSVLMDNVHVEPETIIDGTTNIVPKEIQKHLKGVLQKKSQYSGVFASPDSTVQGFYPEMTCLE